jgi:hypothetical protein
MKAVDVVFLEPIGPLAVKLDPLLNGGNKPSHDQHGLIMARPSSV